METKLQIQTTLQKAQRTSIRKQPTNLPPIDIYFISLVGFLRTIKQLDTSIFVTSLYEIDQLIEDKEIEAIQRDLAQQELTNEELIDQKLPLQYQDLRDVFSKATLDILVLHQEYNLKIKLEKDTNLGFSPLRHYTLEELKAYKQYLVDNLSKRFIDQS